MRRSQIIMGTGVTLDIPSAKNSAVFNKVFELLVQIDEKFSTYKPGSEVSRFARCEIAEESLSKELKEVIKACRSAETWSDGYFSAWYAAPPDSHLDAVQGSKEEQASRIKHTVSAATDAADAAMRQKPASADSSAGRQGEAVRDRWFEPSGYVKGWAIQQASNLIEKQGFKTYCLSIGGDINARGNKIWPVGVQDPADPQQIITRLDLKNQAVATSGNYARGAHIINPKTKQPATELLSVTITGPDIIWADVLATACFAMGHAKAEQFIKTKPDYRATLV